MEREQKRRGESRRSPRRAPSQLTSQLPIRTWAGNQLRMEYTSGLRESGGKMAILFKVLEESLAIGDKILVFSQSLFTLDLLEEFLSKRKVPRPDMNENWCKNQSYFRTIILISCLLWLYPRTGWEYISTGTGKTDQSVQLTRKYQIMALPSLYQVIPVTVQGPIKPGIMKNQG
uniref:Helicase ARIP4 n=1 Tax=Magallana gigas TaxID=29159 RepID=K1R4A8_MAGGI